MGADHQGVGRAGRLTAKRACIGCCGASWIISVPAALRGGPAPPGRGDLVELGEHPRGLLAGDRVEVDLQPLRLRLQARILQRRQHGLAQRREPFLRYAGRRGERPRQLGLREDHVGYLLLLRRQQRVQPRRVAEVGHRAIASELHDGLELAGLDVDVEGAAHRGFKIAAAAIHFAAHHGERYILGALVAIDDPQVGAEQVLKEQRMLAGDRGRRCRAEQHRSLRADQVGQVPDMLARSFPDAAACDVAVQAADPLEFARVIGRRLVAEQRLERRR